MVLYNKGIPPPPKNLVSRNPFSSKLEQEAHALLPL